MIETRHIAVSKTARLATLGDKQNPKSIWIVLHGYGQLARFFIRKFQPLADKGSLVIAPEGLNRFYLEGYKGRVGATWMTKEDRLQDIEDNKRYLESVMHALTDEFGSDIEINVLAFSQGVATGSRWLMDTSYNIETFIAWAGSIPPEENWGEVASRMNRHHLHYVFGRDDEFFDEEKIEKNIDLWRKAGIECQMHFFSGPHDIDGPTLLRLIGKHE